MSKTVWLITGAGRGMGTDIATSHPHSPMMAADPFWLTPSARVGKTTPRR